MIERRIDKARQLTFHLCEGKISVEDLVTEIRSSNDEEPTPDHLWDLSAADMSGIAIRELERLARLAERTTRGKVIRKTAVVSPKDAEYGLGRVYQAYTDIAGHRAAVGVFRTREEAEGWLDGEVKKE